MINGMTCLQEVIEKRSTELFLSTVEEKCYQLVKMQLLLCCDPVENQTVVAPHLLSCSKWTYYAFPYLLSYTYTYTVYYSGGGSY